MAGLGSGLMATSPGGPAEPVGRIVHGPEDECREQALELVAGERDQPVRGGVAGVFIGADDGEEGVREHGQGDPAGPRGEAADLVLAQSGQALSGLKGLLHSPSRPSNPHQRGQGHRGRRPAAVVGEFASGAIAADQQLVAA